MTARRRLGERLTARLPGGGRSGGADLDARPTLGARGSAWMALAALVAGALAVPFGVDLGGSAFGRLVDGVVEVQEDDGWRVLQPQAQVPAGARVRTGDQSARIEVEDGLLTLAGSSGMEADPALPHLRRGSLLVEADAPLRARVGATTVEGRGTWRVDVGVASRVATYRSRLVLDDGVQRREMGRFRQIDVRDGALEPGLRPLRYEAEDAWDQWLLADALAVDRLADRLERSLARRYGEAPRQLAFFEAFAAVEQGGLGSALEELAVTEEDGRLGPPAALLLGVVVVDALRAEAGLAPAEALQRAVALRRAGATWGLVLVEHDLGAGALRAAVDRALEQVAAEPPPEPIAPGDTPPAPGAGSEPGGGPAPNGTGPSPSPPPVPEVPSPDDGSDEDGALDPVEDTLRDTGDDVGDRVEDTGDELGDLVEDTNEELGDAVDDTTSELGGAVEDTTDAAADTVDDVGSLLDGSSAQQEGTAGGAVEGEDDGDDGDDGGDGGDGGDDDDGSQLLP